MLSQDAYTIAKTLITCPRTVHELKDFITCWPPRYRNQALRSALSELSRVGFIEWTLEPDYHGQAPPVRRRDFSDASLLRDWQLCFGQRGPSQPKPEGEEATLFVYVTDGLLSQFDNCVMQ